MQTILNDPPADPFTLEISSAASFGAPWESCWGGGFHSFYRIGAQDPVEVIGGDRCEAQV